MHPETEQSDAPSEYHQPHAFSRKWKINSHRSVRIMRLIRRATGAEVFHVEAAYYDSFDDACKAIDRMLDGAS